MDVMSVRGFVLVYDTSLSPGVESQVKGRIVAETPCQSFSQQPGHGDIVANGTSWQPILDASCDSQT